MVFGDRLESLRNGETQKGFAKSLGIPINTYTNWVRGIREPSMSAIVNICTHLGVSADWLLSLPERGGSSTTVTGNVGAVAVGAGARASVDIPRAKRAAQAVATGVRVAPRPPPPADCANCKYKRLADAFKAL